MLKVASQESESDSDSVEVTEEDLPTPGCIIDVYKALSPSPAAIYGDLFPPYIPHKKFKISDLPDPFQSYFPSQLPAFPRPSPLSLLALTFLPCSAENPSSFTYLGDASVPLALPSGRGTICSPSSLYHGLFRNGLPHGFGRLYYFDPDTTLVEAIEEGLFYKGRLREGKRLDAEAFVQGSFDKDGNPRGPVLVFYLDGFIVSYEGTMECGTMAGRGRIVYFDGTVFKGEVQDNAPTGYGRAVGGESRQGAISYSGLWYRGKEQGWGSETRARNGWASEGEALWQQGDIKWKAKQEETKQHRLREDVLKVDRISENKSQTIYSEITHNEEAIEIYREQKEYYADTLPVKLTKRTFEKDSELLAKVQMKKRVKKELTLLDNSHNQKRISNRYLDSIEDIYAALDPEKNSRLASKLLCNDDYDLLPLDSIYLKSNLCQIKLSYNIYTALSPFKYLDTSRTSILPPLQFSPSWYALTSLSTCTYWVNETLCSASYFASPCSLEFEELPCGIGTISTSEWVYHGSFNRGQPHGFGRLSTHKNEALEGFFRFGTLKNGTIYRYLEVIQGQFIDGLAHGICTIWRANEIIKGCFYNGLLHGSFKMLSDDGTVLESENFAARGVKCAGWTNKVDITGCITQGVFNNSSMNGWGWERSTKGSPEESSIWINNCKVEYAEIIKCEGIYLGWVDDRDEPWGLGTFITNTDWVYVGWFENGVQHGHGDMIYANGELYHGAWTNGKRGGSSSDLKFGKMLFSNDDRYEGEWSDDKIHGSGTMHFANGNIYKGIWQQGIMHGHGSMYYSDGRVQKGIWDNGVYVDH